MRNTNQECEWNDIFDSYGSETTFDLVIKGPEIDRILVYLHNGKGAVIDHVYDSQMSEFLMSFPLPEPPKDLPLSENEFREKASQWEKEIKAIAESKGLTFTNKGIEKNAWGDNWILSVCVSQK